jgi:hypothetical protein
MQHCFKVSSRKSAISEALYSSSGNLARAHILEHKTYLGNKIKNRSITDMETYSPLTLPKLSSSALALVLHHLAFVGGKKGPPPPTFTSRPPYSRKYLCTFSTVCSYCTLVQDLPAICFFLYIYSANKFCSL